MSGLTPQHKKTRKPKIKSKLSGLKIYTFDELRVKLTPKEKRFCHEYIVDWNKARAARTAGYSPETAKEIGYENLTKPHIQQYIAFIKNNLEEEAGISKLRNLQELAKIAYSNISHLHDCWIELTDWEVIKSDNPDAMSAIESIDTKTESRTYNKGEISETDIEVKYVKIKLHPKLVAIKEINSMMGYSAPVKMQHAIEDLSYLDEIIKGIKG
ncbi:MAG: terminase small subunit [Paludibacter sp.]|nr:terminase small subunit [Paludibacter sp.]